MNIAYIAILSATILLFAILLIRKYYKNKYDPKINNTDNSLKSTISLQEIINNNQDADIYFGEPDKPIIKFEKIYDKSTNINSNDNKNLDVLKPLASEIMSMTGITLHSGSRYKLAFRPELKEMMSSGSASLMPSREGGFRLNVVDKNKKVLGQGSLKNFDKATAALGIWQIMSIVTSQKYLHDISVKLAKIEKGIESIKVFLESHEYGKMIGNFRYLTNTLQSIQNGKFDDKSLTVYLNQLEHIERESLELLEAINYRRKTDIFENAKFYGCGLKDNFNDLIARLNDYMKDSKIELMASHIRAINCRVRCALQFDNHSIHLRIKEIEEQIRCIKILHEENYPKCKNRIGELKGKWSFDSTDEDYQRQLKEHISTIFDDLTKKSKEVYDITTETENIYNRYINDKEIPVALEFSLGEDGIISTVREIDGHGTDFALPLEIGNAHQLR